MSSTPAAQRGSLRIRRRSDEGPSAAGAATEATITVDGPLRVALALLESHVHTAVLARREVDENPDDAFRGLYVNDADVDRLLQGGWPTIAPRSAELVAAQRRAESSLEHAPGVLFGFADRFSLSPLDLDLLVVALAPDVDARFEKLYGYLNDDVTRRRATVGLALELCGELSGALGRSRLSPTSPLVSGGLVEVDDPERPFLTRTLRVPDRVTAHLLGDDSPPLEVEDVLAASVSFVDLDASAFANAIDAGVDLAYVRDRPGAAGRSLAERALEGAGLAVLSIDLTRLSPESDVAGFALAAAREARLLGAGIVAGPLDALGDLATERGRVAARAFAEMPVVTVLIGRTNWDPLISRRVPLIVEAPYLGRDAMVGAWKRGLDAGPDEAEEIAQVTEAFLLAPEQIERASISALHQASYDNSTLKAAHVRSGALSQNAAGLERMARRIQPNVTWDDLVLPSAPAMMLRELVARVRHRDQVLGEWQMRPGGGRGRGVTALFAGESGTGKTMSAEVVAGDLGLELYTINLATVVDKYIGETEKNLERIFSEVSGVNGVLLFDEADALFGKRSDVKDAHDRYANIEVAYLLQRIESFDGLAILATNLRANVDEAFTRRLDAVIDFPFPDVSERRELWEHCLGASAPRSSDVDIDFLATSFELAGGNIRSVALTAGYLAAEQQSSLSMTTLIKAVHREYRKIGRLLVPSEFGSWFSVLADEIGRNSAT